MGGIFGGIQRVLHGPHPLVLLVGFVAADHRAPVGVLVPCCGRNPRTPVGKVSNFVEILSGAVPLLKLRRARPPTRTYTSTHTDFV